MAREKGRWLMRSPLLALVTLCLVSTTAACQTTRGGGEIQAREITKNLDSATDDLDKLKDQVNTSNATPEQKAQMTRDLEAAKRKIQAEKPAIVQVGKNSDHNQAAALSNEAKAKAMNLVLFLGVILVVIGVLAWRIQKSKNP